VEDIGKRLKEERERLGLTQAEFAKACGVGRTAQFNYEREERSPSSEYLDAAEALGADSLYIMSGTKKGDDWVYARAYKAMLYTIEMLLGLEENRLEQIALKAVEIDRALKDNAALITKEEYNLMVIDWLKSTTKVERCIDLDLFASILTSIEVIIERTGLSISPVKKSGAVTMLYRSFKPTGIIDHAMIEDTVKLAAS
jgi:transcriptional regulator with XRE-family HTH domain